MAQPVRRHRTPYLQAPTSLPWGRSRGSAPREHVNGARADWTGQEFRSRQGNLFHAPDWFVAGLPDVPLDGELWLGRKQFQRAVSIVRRQDKNDLWKEIRFQLFDAPALDGE